MIPRFPQFKRLDISDNDDVEGFTRNFPYYSDFNFSSLWSWDINHRREISVLNDNLVVKFTDYETDEYFLTYLGMRDNAQTVKTLLDYSESIGLPPILKLMPEISVHDLDEAFDLDITPDKANFDYIYLTSHLAILDGNRYKSKRRAAERFEKSYPNHDYEVLDLSESRTQDAVRSIASSWRQRRGHAIDDQSIVHEIEAIENIFKLAKIRDLFVGVVTIDGIPNAFTIEEIVNQILSIGHFWKTANPFPGEYEYLAARTASYLESREVTYWNWEQDLGIDSLRASKSSYRPSDFLKKFIVTRRQIS